MKFKIILVIIFLQVVIIIIILFLQVKNKRTNIFNISVNTINSKYIQKSQSEVLKYFYEPLPNTIQQIHENWLPYIAKYTINSDALNERFDYQIKKEKGTYRIITIGDSFTFGENVSTERNWTELIEDYLNINLLCNKITKYEVINLGLYGYDTQYEVERYRMRGKKYNPDLVIWTFTDFERILERMMPLIKQNETIQNKALEKKGIFYSNWNIAREEMIKDIGHNNIVNYQKEQIQLFDQYYKGDLLFITMPNAAEYIQILKKVTNKRPFSHLFQPNIQWGESNLFLPDNHFNDAGNQKMMEEIVGYLIKDKLIPCTQQTSR